MTQESALCPECQSENLRYFHSAGFNRVACNDCQHVWAKGLHNDLTAKKISSSRPYAEEVDDTIIYERRLAPGDTKRLSHENRDFRRASRNHKKVG